MIVDIMDYANKKVSFDIGELEDIRGIMMDVVTGDEILSVMYKDGTLRQFDSSRDRVMDFHDFSYAVYVDGTDTDLLSDPDFLNRQTSYSFGY